MTRTKIASGFSSLFSFISFFSCCCFVSRSFEHGNDVFVFYFIFPMREVDVTSGGEQLCGSFTSTCELIWGEKQNQVELQSGYEGEELGLPFCFSGREFRLVNATLTHRWDALSNPQLKKKTTTSLLQQPSWLNRIGTKFRWVRSTPFHPPVKNDLRIFRLFAYAWLFSCRRCGCRWGPRLGYNWIELNATSRLAPANATSFEVNLQPNKTLWLLSINKKITIFRKLIA